jgi:hypothetical protein
MQRKEQYEPINEQVTLTAEVLPEADVEAAVEELEERAWDAAERGVMRRYEENVRKDDE